MPEAHRWRRIAHILQARRKSFVHTLNTESGLCRKLIALRAGHGAELVERSCSANAYSACSAGCCSTCQKRNERALRQLSPWRCALASHGVR